MLLLLLQIPVDKVRTIVENFLEDGLSQLTPKAVKQVHYATSHYATALHRTAPQCRTCAASMLCLAASQRCSGRYHAGRGVRLLCPASSDTMYVPVTVIR